MKKNYLIYSLILILLIGLSYLGMLMEKEYKRPIGPFAFITLPYRGYNWLKYNEPVFIPSIPNDTMNYYYGGHISRTMTLLETSNEENKNRVKILFYGQSIIQNLNSDRIIRNLKRKYPDAIIEYENRAIGGFEAPNLVRTAVHDLYPYYPDLLIFHVYGGEKSGELERIIYNTRKYTTSEIMLLNHHYAWVKDSLELKIRTEKDDLSSEYWRYIAQKYDCELVDVRYHWGKYLEKNPEFGINTLMGDKIHSNVHPNEEGNELLEQLIMRQLVYNPYFVHKSNQWYSQIIDYNLLRPMEEKKDEIVISGKYYKNIDQILLNSGILSLNFTGNKLELITSKSYKNGGGSLEVLIDGEKPSTFESLYYCTRPSTAFRHWSPAIKRVSLGSNPIPEKWTIIITKIDYKANYLEYKIVGDKTGFDGEGNNLNKFVSNSGRIIIDGTDFNIFDVDKFTGKKTPLGYKIHWEVKPLFQDVIKFNKRDSIYLIAQGLSNSKHVLTLKKNEERGSFPIKAVRVYKPPLK